MFIDRFTDVIKFETLDFLPRLEACKTILVSRYSYSQRESLCNWLRHKDKFPAHISDGQIPHCYRLPQNICSIMFKLVQTQSNNREILDFLLQVDKETLFKIARVFQNALDKMVSGLGLHIEKSLMTTTFGEAAPFYYPLNRFFSGGKAPFVNAYSKLFEHQFPPFFRGYLELPPKTCYLSIDADPKVLIHQQLLIGRYKHSIQRSDDMYKDDLLVAHHKESKELVWALALDSDQIDFSGAPLTNYLSTPLGIALFKEGQNKVVFINPEDGTLSRVVSLPETGDKVDHFHLTPTGFCYLITEKATFGFHLSDKKRFFFRHPFSHNFDLLGEFLHFDDSNYQMVVDKEGTIKKFDTFAKLQIFNNHLFSFEGQPDGSKNLKVFFMENGQLSKAKEIYNSPTRGICIGMVDPMTAVLLNNGTVFNEKKSTLWFLDLKTGGNPKLELSDFALDKTYIDGQKKQIWGWDEFTKELRVITAAGSQHIGRLDTTQETHLLHVDEEGILYFNVVRF